MALQIQKTKDRFHCPAFLRYVRSLPCCVCGSPSTASHMISVKRADGSDALAVNACMPLHHVQSTKVSREILERAGIDLQKQHAILWTGFLKSLGKDRDCYTQETFEALCEVLKLRVPPPTKRKNR